MGKAKPVSLYPLGFDQALDLLLNTPPEAKAEKPPCAVRPAKRKNKKRKRKPKGRR